VAILDGNVKRVLTRVLGFDADLACAANERRLWDAAGELLPTVNLQDTMPRYTQGVMDLGATVCTSKKPRCTICPLTDACVARYLGQPDRYPVKNRKVKRSSQSIWLLWAQTAGASVFLTKRPVPGVWGGLYCFPLFNDRESLEESVSIALRSALEDTPVISHVLTHKDLFLHPVRVTLESHELAGSPGGLWVAADQARELGLPAPIRKLLLRA
jgi:A/G-specific adenine glycosylase